MTKPIAIYVAIINIYYIVGTVRMLYPCPYVIDSCCVVITRRVTIRTPFSRLLQLATRMAVHGTLAPFDPDEEDWVEYTNRLSYYFTANGITDGARKRTIFISCSRPATFRLMKSLVFPDQLDDFSFQQLVEKVKLHREPKVSIIVRRFQFNTRIRSLDESVVDYVAALRRLAEHCALGNMLDKMLRDRLVCGISNSAVQKRLLAETDLTLAKAISVAQAAEIADTGVKELQPTTASANNLFTEDKEIHKFTLGHSVKPQDHYIEPKDCYHCGAKHNPDRCQFKLEKCHACGKQGHIAKLCQSRKKLQSPRNDSTSRATHQVVELSKNTSDYNLLPIGCRDGKPLQTTVQLEGHSFVMEVDTGAAVSLINETTYRSSSFLKKLPLQLSTVQLCTSTGEKISVKGELLVTVQSRSQVRTHPTTLSRDRSRS